MNEIEKILNKAILRGDISFSTPADAIDLIKACKKIEKWILGIDAFILTDKTTQPVMEDSIDYSMFNNYKSPQNWDEAIEFIEQKRGQDYYFEVVFE